MVEGRKESRARTVIELSVYAAYTIIFTLSLYYIYIYNVLYMCVCMYVLYPFPVGSVVKNLLPYRRLRFDLWVRKIPRRMKWQRLQYSCLGNAMDRGSWWATIHGVAKSRT